MWPDVCQGIILTGLCVGCDWDGPIYAGSAGRQPPQSLKVEAGKLVCGCPPSFQDPDVTVSCDISALDDDALETLKAEYGDAVYFGRGELDY